MQCTSQNFPESCVTLAQNVMLPLSFYQGKEEGRRKEGGRGH